MIRGNLSKEGTGRTTETCFFLPYPSSASAPTLLASVCLIRVESFRQQTRRVRVESLAPRRILEIPLLLPTAWWTNQRRLARHRHRIESPCLFVGCMSPSCRPSLGRTEFLRELMKLCAMPVKHDPRRLLVIPATHTTTWPPRFIRSMPRAVPIATAYFPLPHRPYQIH